MNEKIYDLIIIGSGPAGLAAAIYAERAKLNFLVIEKNYLSGGQVLNTYEVDNYPGLQGIGGFDLGMKLREHAEKLGAVFSEDEVVEIKRSEDLKKVVTKDAVYETRTIILASGADHRKLGISGEEKLRGMGVSYCATCDGAFFKNKIAAVVGGGDVAAEDAIFLARICKKVYLIHRRDELRAAKILQERVFAEQNIEMLWDTVVTQINGEEKVESINLKNVKTEEESKLELNGVFVAVGITPNTGIYENLVKMDAQGYIIADEDGITNVPGIFAAGDLRTKQLRQIITAASDGANAVTSVQNYLIENKA